ncbi:hypothetical protein CTheo_1691 [Ceratobasidium theobromae]|uniref:Alpha-galactosidase n=1 Tax=Ceratobasidium theobromae TaxID=1582974 RepID=A0A5N5QUM3_9AGAM|nr:hypothetical protein CTheo_1691 [Ceratobasidium theobromae]
MADRSRSRGREFQSTGRGGAGNIVRSESIPRSPEDGILGQERGREILPASRLTHSGRGGAGNIRSPSRDPAEDIRTLNRERELIEDHRRSEEGQIHSTGRGGYGNMDRSRSRSREPRSFEPVHSSGRGGYGNIASGDGRGLANLEEEVRAQHIQVPEFHSSGRGGAGNVVAGSVPIPEIITPTSAANDAQWRSSGRGGAGNMKPVHPTDPHGAAEEARGRKEHHGLGGFIDRLTSRSRDAQNRDHYAYLMVCDVADMCLALTRFTCECSYYLPSDSYAYYFPAKGRVYNYTSSLAVRQRALLLLNSITMARSFKVTTATLILGCATSLVTVQAQQPLYAQCGGITWTGGTTCVAGAVCTWYNDYYSQCVPGSATSSTSTSTSTTSRATTTTTTGAQTTTSTTTATTTSSAAPQASGAGPSRQVGKTPALGWNSWNAYQGNINDAKIRAAADALISLGLKDAGYTYVNVDDCWSNITGRDTGTNRIKPDLNKFPSGIKSVADYVHSLGLLFGIYSDAGTLTCAGYPGSLGYETIDAQTFAEWGIDYLKYDNCNVPSNWTDTYSGDANYDWYNSNSATRYRQMTTALSSVESIRPIQYGNANVWTWGSRVGHSWRMSGDSSATWSYITSIIARNVDYINYVDFYGHNDMDMMEIGNGALTVNEQRTHFAMWVALKSPILLGTDLSKLNSTQLAIIKNAELLAFSQDTTVGAPAKPYKTGTTPPEFYAGKSSKGMHVFIINTGSAAASKVVTFSEVTGLTCTTCKVHDMWTGKDLGTFTTNYTLTVDTHDTAALLLT